MPRIVSLIASATEIVCALGFEDQLVGRSHECDFPESVKRLPVCTAPKFNVHGSSREIDERVKSSLQEGFSVYDVDTELLQQLQPDVIVTQAQCEVCAVSLRDVERAIGNWPGASPRVVTLNPNCLADVWDDIARLAEGLGAPERGRCLLHALRGQMKDRTELVRSFQEVGEVSRPTVACLEWLDPLMAAGNWMPELVEMAGGIDLFGSAGKHSPWMTWEQLRDRDPDVIVAMPCGLDLQRTRAEMVSLTGRHYWPALRAVQTGSVYLTDGNQFFNRPGPRLVESLGILVEILYAGRSKSFSQKHPGTGWQAL
jgi:iron complex transport system substrate-binding protein